MHATEQTTLPLEVWAVQGAFLFRAYLKTHNLHPLTVSFASHVRYLIIWNIEHGVPITREHEVRVRMGLLVLTGVPFTAPLAVRLDTEQNKLGRVRLVRMSHFD